MSSTSGASNRPTVIPKIHNQNHPIEPLNQLDRRHALHNKFDFVELSRGECEDFLIWNQLMKFAEGEGEDVVFITGEKKEDWWEVDREYNIVRPRHELLKEFRSETGQSFWMLTTEQMLDNAYERTGIDVKEKSVEQTKTISSRDVVFGKGREYYMDEEEMRIQRIRESIENVRKRCHRVSETVKNMKNGINRDKKDVLHRYLALLGSSVESISDRYSRIDNTKRVAIEMSLEKIRESISKGDVEKAIGISDNLESYIDDITEVMVNKIREQDD